MTQPKFGDQTVALVAVNDSFILEGHVFRLLRKHFRSHPNYIDLVDLFHEVAYQTELGQLLDLTSQPSGEKVDLSLFTLDTYSPHRLSINQRLCTHTCARAACMNRYLKIVRYKTAFYSFYLPIALGMYLSGHATEELLAQAKAILLPMGEFFQIQARLSRTTASNADAPASD
jgi:farnesyl diphosphate synthase